MATNEVTFFPFALILPLFETQFGDSSKKEDELTRYLNAPVLVSEDNEANDALDILEWGRGDAKEFTILARIAFDIYSIPAMSVQLERVLGAYVPENRRV